MHRLAACLLGLTMLVTPITGLAQNRDREAREHFQVGRDSFNNGDYVTAVSEFERAFELSGRPQLLYNIGTSYDRLHRWQQARDSFRRYLQALPDSLDRAEVEGRLRVIEDEIQRAEAATRPHVVVVERPVIVQRIVRDEPARPWRTVFWVAGAATLAAGTATLVVGLLANTRYNNLLISCGNTTQGCPRADIDDMNVRQTVVNIGIATTSVLAAGALVSYLLDATRSRESAGPPRASLAPLPGGGILFFEGAL